MKTLDDPDAYEVTLRCVCGAEVVALRWHRHDPYAEIPFVCPRCVVQREGK
jgi:hypothetical protein